jgi:hypothetical protein
MRATEAIIDRDLGFRVLVCFFLRIVFLTAEAAALRRRAEAGFRRLFTICRDPTHPAKRGKRSREVGRVSKLVLKLPQKVNRVGMMQELKERFLDLQSFHIATSTESVTTKFHSFSVH